MVQTVNRYVGFVVSLLTKRVTVLYRCEWAFLLYAVKCCFICLYPVSPKFLMLLGLQGTNLRCCHIVLCFTRVLAVMAEQDLPLAGGTGLGTLEWPSSAPLGKHVLLHAKGCLLPRWPVQVRFRRLGCFVCVRSSSSSKIV